MSEHLMRGLDDQRARADDMRTEMKENQCVAFTATPRMSSAEIELGYIRALVGAADKETTFNAVQRMMADWRKRDEHCYRHHGGLRQMNALIAARHSPKPGGDL